MVRFVRKIKKITLPYRRLWHNNQYENSKHKFKVKRMCHFHSSRVTVYISTSGNVRKCPRHCSYITRNRSEMFVTWRKHLRHRSEPLVIWLVRTRECSQVSVNTRSLADPIVYVRNVIFPQSRNDIFPHNGVTDLVVDPVLVGAICYRWGTIYWSDNTGE